MKRKISITGLLGILLLPVTGIFAQTSSATWNLTSNGNASVSGNVTGGAISKGAGARSGGISAMSYNSNGVSSTNWISYSYLQFSITSQSYNKDYYQYTVSPASGTNFTVNNISYEVSASTAPVSWFAYYSLDGFSTYTALGARNATSHTGLNIQVPAGSTLTLRIYGMDLVSAGTSFRNKNVVISGSSAAPCQAQTANAGSEVSICKGTSTVALGGNVGGSATAGTWSSNAGGTFAPNASDLNATWTPPSEYTGTATLTLTTTNGCSTNASSNKFVTVQQPSLNNGISISQDSTMLTANETNASYQWLRCDEEGVPVAGATMQTFSPQQTGSYSVRVTALSCPNVVSYSQCISVSKDNVGVAGNLNVAGISEFSGEVRISNKVVLNQLDGVNAEEPEIDNANLVLRGGDGVLKSLTFTQFEGLIYRDKFCFEGSLPVWSNGPGKIYTNCGNVGIGTNNPLYSLHAMGNGYFNTTLHVNSGLSVGTDPSNFSKFIIRNNNRNAALQIDQSGNTNNYAKLMFMEYTNAGTEIIKVVNSETGHVPLLIDVDGNLRLKNGTREIFNVNAASQTVFARKIVVDEETWPDYVFEKNYNLLPLNDVKSFIAENGHLPNVPSREKILEEGVDLGKMVHVLVEKVEELTLYSIQQQEEIEALKKLLEQQQNRNK